MTQTAHSTNKRIEKRREEEMTCSRREHVTQTEAENSCTAATVCEKEAEGGREMGEGEESAHRYTHDSRTFTCGRAVP